MLQPGRKPTPTRLKLLQGNPGKRRLPESEVRGVGELGDAPAGFAPLGKALWHELAGQVPFGVATASDRVAFEVLVRLVGIMRADPCALTPALAGQIRNACAEFGLTPSARTRLPAPPTSSKFEGLCGPFGRDPEGYFT
jgi:hypothetical protein